MLSWTRRRAEWYPTRSGSETYAMGLSSVSEEVQLHARWLKSRCTSLKEPAVRCWALSSTVSAIPREDITASIIRTDTVSITPENIMAENKK